MPLPLSVPSRADQRRTKTRSLLVGWALKNGGVTPERTPLSLRFTSTRRRMMPASIPLELVAPHRVDQNVGNFRIKAAAIPSGKCFRAADVVKCNHGLKSGAQVDVFCNERVGDGHGWKSPERALATAVVNGWQGSLGSSALDRKRPRIPRPSRSRQRLTPIPARNRVCTRR